MKIIGVWIQLIIVAVVLFIIYSTLLKIIQKAAPSSEKSRDLMLIATTPVLILLYCIIAWYNSTSLDMYSLENSSSRVITAITFLVLAFLFLGPVKYSRTTEEKVQVCFSSVIALALFSVWRDHPSFAKALFNWVPVGLWY